MKKILFIAYGGGHIKMVLPVARALAQAGHEVAVLALTTAAAYVESSGLKMLRFKDFLLPEDDAAVQEGRRLMLEMNVPVIDAQESAAYLGLSYRDLVQQVGPAQAQTLYAEKGRQAFFPLPTLRRILQRVRPDMVVATNAPRAERAAIVAARELSIPAVCMVDLFALDEVDWIGATDYADRVCVLNESVKQFLLDHGRASHQVCVTGNPGFDALFNPQHLVLGQALRECHGWQGKTVLLWASQVEPAVHPQTGAKGSPNLPYEVLTRLAQWTIMNDDFVLCVRPRLEEADPKLPFDPRIVYTRQDWPLATLLHAVDCVVTLTSTVGLEGRMVGTRLIQVQGSVFDDAMPLKRYGFADALTTVDELPRVLRQQAGQPRHTPFSFNQTSATNQVVALIEQGLTNGF